MNKELSLKENLYVARVFLNTFGFYLENIDKIYSDTFIKLYNKDNYEVGYLYFDDDDIIIEANYTRGYLKARYKKANISTHKEPYNSGKIVGEWLQKIDFNIFDSYSKNIWGEFLVKASIDNQSNKKCTCYPLIKYKSKIGGDMTIKMHRDKKIFELLVKDKPIVEHITIDDDGSLLHNRIIGGYVKNRGFYGRRRAGVVPSENDPKNKMRVFF